ncbi:MAG: hypothetical protein ACI9JM_003473 [Halioglobus sp.]|jgi:hypothetical protein
MTISRATHNITLAAILATILSSTIAHAESDKDSSKRRGPPEQAFEACADQAEKGACSFSGRRGDVPGTCIVPPHADAELVCAPEGGPPEGHGERHDRE